MNNVLIALVIISIKIYQMNGELTEVVDLTWKFDNDTIYWRGVTPLSYTKKITKVRDDGVWYAMNEFCAGEHGGTHFDAPYHFYREGWTVGQIPLSNLIVPGAVIDVSSEVAKDGPNAVLKTSHLTEWEVKHGQFLKSSVLLVRFDWSKHYPNKTAYMGLNQEGQLNFPGISKGAAEWIVNSKKFVGVGLDTASADAGNTTAYDAHRILAESQIYILENVKLTYDLPAKGFTLFVMPMKLADGTGAPLRVVAVPGSNYDFFS